MTLETILCELNREVECLACEVYCRKFGIVPQFNYSFRKHIMKFYFNLEA